MMFPQAGASLSVSQDQLVRVHRALLLLKSHLKTFRRKYASGTYFIFDLLFLAGNQLYELKCHR